MNRVCGGFCRFCFRKRLFMNANEEVVFDVTFAAINALHTLQKAGTIVANQTPIIRGVNDSSEVLGGLFDKLSFIGVPPYYVFQCRPTQGNRHLALPVEEAYEIHEQAKMNSSGLSKRSRFVMSHSIGKIEVLGMTEELILFRFHRAARYDQKGYLIMFRKNPEAYWYDDYTEVVSDYALQNPFYHYDNDSESVISNNDMINTM